MRRRSLRSLCGKVFLYVSQEHLNVFCVLPAPLWRVSHIFVDGSQILERIQLVDEFPLWSEEHQVQRKLPVSGDRAGEFVPHFSAFLRIVDQYPRRDERVVDVLNHCRFGEQTCSQVGSAGSTTLVVEIPPQNDRKNRTIPFPGLCKGCFRLHPLNFDKLVERSFQLAAGRGQRDLL